MDVEQTSTAAAGVYAIFDWVGCAAIGLDATKKGVDATKKGVEDAAKGTKKGAEKVGDKVNPKNW